MAARKTSLDRARETEQVMKAAAAEHDVALPTKASRTRSALATTPTVDRDAPIKPLKLCPACLKARREYRRALRARREARRSLLAKGG